MRSKSSFKINACWSFQWKRAPDCSRRNAGPFPSHSVADSSDRDRVFSGLPGGRTRAPLPSKRVLAVQVAHMPQRPIYWRQQTGRVFIKLYTWSMQKKKIKRLYASKALLIFLFRMQISHVGFERGEGVMTTAVPSSSFLWLSFESSLI